MHQHPTNPIRTPSSLQAKQNRFKPAWAACACMQSLIWMAHLTDSEPLAAHVVVHSEVQTRAELLSTFAHSLNHYFYTTTRFPVLRTRHVENTCIIVFHCSRSLHFLHQSYACPIAARSSLTYSFQLFSGLPLAPLPVIVLNIICRGNLTLSILATCPSHFIIRVPI